MKNKKIIDLTHTISEDSATWDGSCGFHLTTKTDYSDCTAPDIFKVQKIESNAGIATHIDAPAHCIPGAKTVDELLLNELIVPAVLIKVNETSIPEYVVSKEDIISFEEKHGFISPNTFVIFYTHWYKYWEDKEKYRNNYVFPSITKEVAQILLDRNISGIGIDTLSLDTGVNGFPVHQLVLGKGNYLVENITNLESIPDTHFTIGIFPMKIKGGTESPIRLVAFI